MAELQFSLTELGYKTLISKGLTDTLTYYSLGDFDHNYTIKNAENDILSKITGYHEQITESQCGKAKYEGMFPTDPTEEQILNTRSRLQYQFNRVDCDYEFVKPSINLRVNINSWLNELSNISNYSYDMSESLILELWSYVSILNQRVDLVSNDYKTYDTLLNNSLIYTPQTSEDAKIFEMVSPKYVEITEKGEKQLVWNNKIRYQSPMMLTFSTNQFNGQTLVGTRALLSLLPNEWGYYCDGQFLTIETVEDVDPSNLPWNTIYPAVNVGNETFILTTNESYLTSSKLIGYLMNMVSVKDGSTTALQRLIENTKLFFKANANLTPSGAYELVMNFDVYGKNAKVDSIGNIIGNIFSITLSYDSNNNTAEKIELI